jgi:hypothetical protein
MAASIGTVPGLATAIRIDTAALSSQLLVEAFGQLTEGVSGLAQLPILFFQRPHGCQHSFNRPSRSSSVIPGLLGLGGTALYRSIRSFDRGDRLSSHTPIDPVRHLVSATPLPAGRLRAQSRER